MSKLSYKSLFTILFFLLIGVVILSRFVLPSKKVSASWWNDSWSYRKAINIGNSGASTTNQYIKITLDTATLITDGKIKNTCDDIRVTNINGKLLTHFIDGNTNFACNTSTTSIYVLLDSIPNSGNTIYVYYGNPVATNIEPQLGTQQNPAISCKNILQHRSDNKGTQQYYITPTGNLADSIQVNCDMTYSSGGWIQVWHGLPSEAFANDSTHETINLSNNIIFNDMRVEGTNLNFNVVDTVTQTAMLGSSIRTYFNQVHVASDASSPKATFHNLSGVQNINLTNNYFMYGYGNSWRFFYTCIDISSIDYLYLGGGSPTCTPRSSFASTELGCTSGGNYCSNSRTTTPTDSGLHLSLYQYQESSVYVRESAITLNSSQSIESISSEEVGGGPIAYWKFDEGVGTTAYDSTSQNNTGTFLSAPIWKNESECVSGKCLAFDNVDDGVSINNNFTELTDYTMCAWINIKGNHKNYSGTIMSSGNWNNSYWGFTLNQANTRIEARKADGVNTPTWNYTFSLNQWTHVCITRASTKITAYTNGKQIGSPFTGTTGNIGSTAANTTIGRETYAGGYFAFNGWIDEPKIYPYARTADQIKQDYNSRGSLSGSSVNLGIKSSTAPDLNSSLVAYWKLNENIGTSVFDSSINKTNGYLAGTTKPTWTTGKYNSGIAFSGVNDSLIIPYKPNFRNAVTVSIWMKRTTGYNQLTDVMLLSPPNAWYFYDSYNTGLIHGDVYIDGVRKGAATVPVPFDGNWYHIVYTYDSATHFAKMYKNGVLYQSVEITGLSNYLIDSATGNISNIGLNNSGRGMILDEPRIYNRALTADEVKQDYNQGSSVVFGTTNQTIGGTTTSLEYCIPGDTSVCLPPIDEWNFEENAGNIAYDTGTSHNNGLLGAGVSTSSPAWTVGKKNTGAGLKFDGIDDRVTLTSTINLVSGNDWTVSAWVKTNTVSGSILSNSSGGPVANDLRIANSKISYAHYNSAWLYEYGNINIADNNWHYLTWVNHSNRTMDMYVDGVGDTLGVGSSQSTGPVNQIGRNWSASSNAIIDQVKIYNYARTPAQIAYDYNKGGPIAWWKLDECQGSVVNNSSGIGNTGSINIGSSGSQTSVGTCTTSGTAWGNGASGHINSSLNFDGVDDYVTIANNSILNPTTGITVSSWIKWNTNNAQWEWLVAKNSNSSATNGYMFFKDPGTDTIGFAVDGIRATLPRISFNTGVWYHLVGTATAGGTANLYVNGKLVASSNSVPNPIVQYSNYLGINKSPYYSSPAIFNGQIDDVRIYNYALTPEQVKTVYNNGAVNFR
ncbi:MAG: DUF2341 domain-containing protein [Candidatus Shapirobacteria bacterium]|nr:DUF2341 domain-containing protein [Candidatus Shapirobacteria bacterium]